MFEETVVIGAVAENALPFAEGDGFVVTTIGMAHRGSRGDARTNAPLQLDMMRLIKGAKRRPLHCLTGRDRAGHRSR